MEQIGVTVPVMLLARWRRLFNFSSCQREETKVRHCRFNTKRINYMDDLNQNCDGRTVSGGKVKGSKVKKTPNVAPSGKYFQPPCGNGTKQRKTYATVL